MKDTGSPEAEARSQQWTSNIFVLCPLLHQQAWLQGLPEATSEWRWEWPGIHPDDHEGRTRCLQSCIGLLDSGSH